MTPIIELVYFNGCSNVDAARANLRAALVAAKLALTWQEWEQGDPAAPSHVRRFSSPTVLVNARDVTGQEAGDGGASCRADGAPSVELVRTALEGAS